MTTPTQAAQSVLTDLEIQETLGAILVASHPYGRRDVLSQWELENAAARAIETAVLSKLRAPVADESLAVQALKAAQNNIAACRPPGSSDPKSPQYDHDAFMWDYYQRAIDSLALASAPVARAIQWPTMPASKGQSPVLFEDGYAEGWAKCMDECRRAVSQASAPVADTVRLDFVAFRCTIWDGEKHVMATREAIDAAMAGGASAPVAGEAQIEVAKLAEELSDLASDMAYEANQEMDQDKANRAAVIERGERALRGFVDAALQASPVAGEAQPDDLNKRLLEATIRDLAAISEHLGLDPNEGGADPIIEAIDELRRERDDCVDAQYAAAANAAPQASADTENCGLCGRKQLVNTAPTAAEGSEDDMLTIAYLAGAQAEKERAALADRQRRNVNRTSSDVDIDRQRRDGDELTHLRAENERLRNGVDQDMAEVGRVQALYDSEWRKCQRLRAAFDHPVFAFLLGEGQLHGVDFGERAPGAVGKWWWRKDLRAALAARKEGDGNAN
ncbi:hypothetical protein [Bordetella bronchiseptica]|uniref:hypothetical protein n=1 Tax=Bordetella bronchiseptica TaxID=518 RepID=UPI003EDC36B1